MSSVDMRGLVHVTSLVELLHMRLVTERQSAMARDLLTDRLYNLTSPLIPPSHGRHKVQVFLQLLGQVCVVDGRRAGTAMCPYGDACSNSLGQREPASVGLPRRRTGV